MTSKEALEMIRSIDGSISAEQTINECCDIIEKDLEDYEKLKNLMGTPIQDIMKRLKILEILKPYFSGAVFPSAINFNFSEEKWKPIKEWLDGKNNL